MTQENPESRKMLDRRDAVVARGLARLNDVAVASGSGARLTDADGRSLIDLAGGIGVLNTGHCPEAVVRAVSEQAARLMHTCIHVATYEPYIELCETLVRLLPHGESTKVMLVNSGAEAVENAVKIARHHTRRPAVLCFSGAFHGRTLLCLTLTSKVAYKKGAGPYAPEVYRLPYPNYYRYGGGLSTKAFVERALGQVEAAFVELVPAEQVAAVVIEPVQGEGGIVPAPPGYLKGLREICDRHGIVLIIDEVQTGFCRTGRWAAYEHHGVVPDLSTWAKSMGGGMPISAVLGRAEVMDAPPPGTLGGTYGGNPVSCAAALAAIRMLEEMDLNARAVEIGERICRRFESIRDRCNKVGDVRGLGAMMAMEFCHDRDPGRPAPELAAEVISGCIREGVLVIGAGSHKNVLRVLCPLVISDEDLEVGLDVIERQVLALHPHR